MSSWLAGPRLVAVLGAALVAMCGAVWAAAGGGEEGVSAAIRATARSSAFLFGPIFGASALARRFRSPFSRWLLRQRRYLGLSFAVSHGLHLLFILELARMGSLQSDATTLYGGGFGFVMIALMAATSNDASVRALRKNWTRLHRFGVYVVWGIFMVSYAPAVPAPIPVAATLWLVAPFVLRWWPAR